MVQILDNAPVDPLPEVTAAAVLDAGQGHLGGLLGTQQSTHLRAAELFDFNLF